LQKIKSSKKEEQREAKIGTADRQRKPPAQNQHGELLEEAKANKKNEKKEKGGRNERKKKKSGQPSGRG